MSIAIVDDERSARTDVAGFFELADVPAGDPRGCVANQYGSSVVYFQEGNSCSAGQVTGQLFCSSFLPPDDLNEGTCPINKDREFHVSDRDGCPDT